jgi:uncharacterized protein (TIGR03382 family)
MRTLALLAVVYPLLAPAPARAVAVWAALASEKIRPSAAARSSAPAHVSAARNEFEPVQIAVTGAATNVRATATALTGPGGATVPAPRLYREAIITLAYASGPDGATGPWPDALVPDVDEFDGQTRNAFPFSVPAGETRVVLADLYVPPGTAAGDYAGSVHVAWDGGDATVPLTLTVWPFTLPSISSLRSAFGFGYGAIPSAHGLTGDAFAQLRARYGVLALDHRVTLSHVDDGFAALDHLVSVYGPSLDGTAATRLPGAKLTAAELLGSASAWASTFQAHGWFDRLFQYTCDEPPGGCAWADIPARAAIAKAADPHLRTLVTTNLALADANAVTGSIDILCPVINHLDDRPGSDYAGNQRAKYDAFLAASPLRELWSYQSCMSHGCGPTTSSDFTGWPSYMIDASAVRNRAMQWLLFRYRLSGELYYETAMAYGGDAWTNQWYFSGNGDGTLFYPGTPARIGGTTHVPVASLRLELIREGMEDYEYLALLSRLGGEADARRIADALFPTAYQTDASPDALMAARAELASRIVALVGTSPDPTPTPTPSDPGTPPVVTAAKARGCSAGGPAGLASAAVLAAAALLARRRRG